MNLIMNLLWDVLGGIVGAILWCIFGALWCITIIGIPFGIMCFKMAGLVIWPFGKEFVYDNKPLSIIFDILWILLTGAELAIFHFVLGLVFCVTIIGIPFGIQHFKIGMQALLPFGTHYV